MQPGLKLFFLLNLNTKKPSTNTLFDKTILKLYGFIKIDRDRVTYLESS